MSREDVRALVSRAAQEQELHPLDLQITRKIRVRSHTDHPATAHFHARSQDRSAEYCIKLFDTSTLENQKFFQREASLLERLSHAKVGQSVSMTPEVLLADATAGILVMEWLNGFSMKSSLFFANYSTGRRNRLLRLSGEWLRQFHEVCGIERKPAEASVMAGGLQADIDKMTDRERALVLSDGAITSAMALLNERAPVMEKTLVEWGLHHHDFTPSNLIVSHKGTVVRGIDFGKASADAPVSLDLASFIVRSCESGANLQFAGSSTGVRLKGTIKAVLNGYSQHLSEADRSWMMWSILYRSVAINVSYCRTGGATGRNTPRRMISHFKRRKVRRLMQVICDLV
jgi:tRNA A-37 threonylcarbamoyl transferase component Bud32